MRAKVLSHHRPPKLICAGAMNDILSKDFPLEKCYVDNDDRDDEYL